MPRMLRRLCIGWTAWAQVGRVEAQPSVSLLSRLRRTASLVSRLMPDPRDRRGVLPDHEKSRLFGRLVLLHAGHWPQVGVCIP